MTDSTAPSGAAAAPGKKSDLLYTAVIAALMLVIVASLAFLWWKERTARQAAQQEIVRLQEANAILARMRVPLPNLDVQPGTPAVSIEEMTQRDVTLDGKSIIAIVIPADTGKRLNFLPGAVIIVDKPKTP